MTAADTKSTIVPNKLKKGDEVRIISPSKSLSIISDEVKDLAVKRLEEMGLKVSFGKYAHEKGPFHSGSTDSRLDDLHDAFADPQVKAILTTIGGYNCNSLLDSIDFNLMKCSPKVFCGYSDITVLQNAFFSKAGLVTFSGPHFSTFGCNKGMDYLIKDFQQTLFEKDSWIINSSTEWSDDPWYMDQNKRTFYPNSGAWAIHQGCAEGVILGGNLSTFALLYGTEYMPDMEGSILFLEDDFESHAELFQRQLVSLTQQKGFDKVQAIVIGRFQPASKITEDVITEIIHTIPILESIPVIAGVDFGHTMPMITLPIGGRAKIIVAPNNQVQITLSKE